jgi:hypothetical protein
MAQQQQSPYPLGTLVRDPRLLNNRRPEIDMAPTLVPKLHRHR